MRLTAKQREVLTMLANSQIATVNLMRALGYERIITGFIERGLVAVRNQRVRAGRTWMAVPYYYVTDAGNELVRRREQRS
jgi:hypothetical protein